MLIVFNFIFFKSFSSRPFDRIILFMSFVCACTAFIFFFLCHRSSFADFWIFSLNGFDVDPIWQSVRASLLFIVKQNWWIAFFFVCCLCLRIFFVLFCDSLLIFIHIRRAIFYKLLFDESQKSIRFSLDRGSQARLSRNIMLKVYAMRKATARAIVINSENVSLFSSHFIFYRYVMRSGADIFDWQTKIVWLFL